MLQFLRQPWFRNRSQITVQIYPRDVDGFEETFSLDDLTRSQERRRRGGEDMAWEERAGQGLAETNKKIISI